MLLRLPKEEAEVLRQIQSAQKKKPSASGSSSAKKSSTVKKTVAPKKSSPSVKKKASTSKKKSSSRKAVKKAAKKKKVTVKKGSSGSKPKAKAPKKVSVKKTVTTKATAKKTPLLAEEKSVLKQVVETVAPKSQLKKEVPKQSGEKTEAKPVLTREKPSKMAVKKTPILREEASVLKQIPETPKAKKMSTKPVEKKQPAATKKTVTTSKHAASKKSVSTSKSKEKVASSISILPAEEPDVLKEILGKKPTITPKPSPLALPKEELKVLKRFIGETKKSGVSPPKTIGETKPKAAPKPQPESQPKPKPVATPKAPPPALPKEELEVLKQFVKSSVLSTETIVKAKPKTTTKPTPLPEETVTETQPSGEGLLIAKTKKEALKTAAQVPGSQIHRYKSVWIVTRPGTTFSKKNIQEEFQVKDVTESYAEQEHYAELGWELYATDAGTFAIPPGIKEESKKEVKQELQELPARELFTGFLVEMEYPSGTKSYRWFRTEEEAQEYVEHEQRRQRLQQGVQEAQLATLEAHASVLEATQGVEQVTRQVEQTVSQITGGKATTPVTGGVLEEATTTVTVTDTKEAEKLIHKQAEKARKEFEQHLKQEEKQARQEFEQKLKEEAEYYRRLDVPESQIKSWMKKNRESFEQNISTWKQEQKTQFQQQLKSWKQEQLSNIKTQLYTKPSSDLWKTSTLAGFLLGIERQFWESISPTSQKKDLLEATPPSLLPGKVKKEIMRPPMAEGLPSGITGQFEAAAYGVAGAFGVKTPSPPPTILELERLREAGPGYTVGAGIGTILGLTLGAKAIGSLGVVGAGTIAKSAAIGAAADVGLTQAVKAASGGGWLTPKEVAQSAVLGAALSVVNIGTVAGAARFVPKLVASRAGRVALQTGFGGLAGYILSKGDVKTSLKAAAFSGLLTAGIEYVGVPLYHEARVKFGRATRLREAGMTFGAGGEKVPVWESPSLEELGGKRIRVVGSVTERPVGTGGVTTESLIKEYVGRKVPASHATLDLSAFKGESVLLRGFPEEARGWRKAAGMFHFYTAPGGEDFVNVYGGYMGIGTGYSGSTPKVRFGGKPGVVVARETYVSPELLPQLGESISEYLARFSFASGKTGISPETVLGFSAERQLSTPASYTRFGVKLPGTLFRPEKVLRGSFQIKQAPSGILGEIPILRTLLSRYTEFGVVVGKFAPVTEKLSITKSLLADLGSLPTAEMSSAPTVTVSPPFATTPLQVISPTVSKTKPSSLLRISTPRFDVSSLISEVSAPSILSDLRQPSLSMKPVSTSKQEISPSLTVSDLIFQPTKTSPKIRKAPSTKKKTVSKPSTPQLPSTTILNVSTPSIRCEKQPSIPSTSILDVSVPSIKHEKKPSVPSILSAILGPSPLVSQPSKPSRIAYPSPSRFKPSISKMKAPSTPKIKISRPPSKISPPSLSPPWISPPRISRGL